MIVSSDVTEGEIVCPNTGFVTLWGIEAARAVIDGRMAVTMVDVAAPPMLKKSLASSNCGYTFLA